MTAMPKTTSNPANFWAGTGVTVCFVAACAMLVSGLLRGPGDFTGHGHAPAVVVANR